MAESSTGANVSPNEAAVTQNSIPQESVSATSSSDASDGSDDFVPKPKKKMKPGAKYVFLLINTVNTL